MHTYRIELELRSALGTPLAADTLWGHVAWGIRYRDGQAALEAWLARYDESPPLVLSDPLPSGYFRRPALPPVPYPAHPPTRDEADWRKRLDKWVWVTHQAWQAICEDVSPESVADAVAASAPPPVPAEAAVTRAGINRLTGGTAQPEGGALFTAEQTYYDFHDPPRFDVWCLSPEPEDTVCQWLADGLAGGYGRDAAAGLGHLVVVAIEQRSLPGPDSPNACVLLGPTVPRPGDPHNGFFNLGVRCGRLGGDFAVGHLPGGAHERQKRPLRCLLAGTVLICHRGVPDSVGRALPGAHSEIPSIRHYGIAPALPCRLTDTLLAHPLVAGSRGTAHSHVSPALESQSP